LAGWLAGWLADSGGGWREITIYFNANFRPERLAISLIWSLRST